MRKILLLFILLTNLNIVFSNSIDCNGNYQSAMLYSKNKIIARVSYVPTGNIVTIFDTLGNPIIRFHEKAWLKYKLATFIIETDSSLFECLVDSNFEILKVEKSERIMNEKDKDRIDILSDKSLEYWKVERYWGDYYIVKDSLNKISSLIFEIKKGEIEIYDYNYKYDSSEISRIKINHANGINLTCDYLFDENLLWSTSIYSRGDQIINYGYITQADEIKTKYEFDIASYNSVLIKEKIVTNLSRFE